MEHLQSHPEDRIRELVYEATPRQLVEFSCRCARRVPQCAIGMCAIATAEAWLRGEATSEECRTAADAAIVNEGVASIVAAAYAAFAAASAERACDYAIDSAYAARAAASSKRSYAAERAWQIDELAEILIGELP